MSKLDLKKIKKIHFTGIKGVGLAALALVAKDMGFQVSGSDLAENFVTEETLKKAGIVPQPGFKEARVKEAGLLIYSASHGGAQNLEVKAAQKIGIPVLSHAPALGLLTQFKKTICVAGVGGKSSTASMIATILATAKIHPSWAIGVGRIDPLGAPARFDKKGKYFVVEADEYFAPAPDTKPKFWYLNPWSAVITNLEYDHPDVYKDLDHTLKVFLRFIEKVPPDGLILVCLDNPNIEKLIQIWPKANRPLDETKAPVLTYGFSKKADWQITLINQSEEKTSFNLKNKNKVFQNIELNVPGEFSVRNAAAAFITAHFCGIKPNKIKEGLEAFKGTQRRFELVKEINGIKLYDDYAHHPAQIKATLKAAKNWFKNQRIIVVFQPHTYTRTKALMLEFSQSFEGADLTVITNIYASAREKVDNSISGKTLVRKIKQYQPEVVFQPGEREVSQYLKQISRPGDVIFTMGAGDIVNWHDKIIKSLKCKVQNDNAKLKIKENILLAPYTSFGIGGKAQYFIESDNQEELVRAVGWAKSKKLPYFVLGSGSNVLISDQGFRGVVIRIKNSKLKVKNGKVKCKTISDAGVSLAKLLNFSIKNSLTGLESLAGIPGTVGGAIAGNAGTKNGSIGQAVIKVTVLSEDGLVYDLNQNECQFAYRQSRFQKTKETILQVEFLLKKDKPELIKKRINQILQTRKNQPQGRSAGSIFKNPTSGKSAGFLIEQCGLKGKKINQAQISPVHGNWIINLGRAKALDVVKLIRLCQKEVKNKFKIELELEVKLVGDFGKKSKIKNQKSKIKRQNI